MAVAERIQEQSLKRVPPLPLRPTENVGETLDFILCTLEPSGLVKKEPRQMEIEAVAGGGFHGRVYIGPDKVIKTSTSDPWHDLWRRINWDFRDFPGQVSETAAKLDYLATNLINGTIPILSGGKYYAPYSEGYTRLPGGFAQVIERLYSRGPRYDTGVDEFALLREAQKEVSDLGYRIGFEQAAQVDPDNPYGFPNLWIDEKRGRIDWGDTLPAIRHTYWVWPFYRFQFHKDVRKRFYPDSNQITFDRVHTDKLREEVARNSHLFSPTQYQRICGEASLYDDLREEFFAEGCTKRNFCGVGVAAVESGRQFLSSAVEGIGEKLVTPPKLILDSGFRRSFVENLACAGINEAHKQRIVTDEEWIRAKQPLSDPESGNKPILKTLGGLYASYEILNYAILKPVELATYAYLFGAENAAKVMKFDFGQILNSPDFIKNFALCAAALVSFRAISGTGRFIEIKIFEKVSGLNLKVASKVAWLPVVGEHLAVPAQLTTSQCDGNEKLWHYNVRHFVAKLSSLGNPAGGWGTQAEAKWWRRIGKHLERLGK